jgi:hypothetical protein
LIKLPRPGPPRQLPAQICGLNGSGNKQARLKNRLISYDFNKLLEFHCNKLPNMASCRNKNIKVSKGAAKLEGSCYFMDVSDFR